jgi:hypothetical protein
VAALPLVVSRSGTTNWCLNANGSWATDWTETRSLTAQACPSLSPRLEAIAMYEYLRLGPCFSFEVALRGNMGGHMGGCVHAGQRRLSAYAYVLVAVAELSRDIAVSRARYQYLHAAESWVGRSIVTREIFLYGRCFIWHDSWWQIV